MVFQACTMGNAPELLSCWLTCFSRMVQPAAFAPCSMPTLRALRMLTTGIPWMIPTLHGLPSFFSSAAVSFAICRDRLAWSLYWKLAAMF